MGPENILAFPLVWSLCWQKLCKYRASVNQPGSPAILNIFNSCLPCRSYFQCSSQGLADSVWPRMPCHSSWGIGLEIRDMLIEFTKVWRVFCFIRSYFLAPVLAHRAVLLFIQGTTALCMAEPGPGLGHPAWFHTASDLLCCFPLACLKKEMLKLITL